MGRANDGMALGTIDTALEARPIGTRGLLVMGYDNTDDIKPFLLAGIVPVTRSISEPASARTAARTAAALSAAAEPQLTQRKRLLFTELGGAADGQRFHSVIFQSPISVFHRH